MATVAGYIAVAGEGELNYHTQSGKRSNSKR